MALGECEINYPKTSFTQEMVEKEINKMDMPEYWKIKEENKNFILKFNPPKIKILKEFKNGGNLNGKERKT